MCHVVEGIFLRHVLFVFFSLQQKMRETRHIITMSPPPQAPTLPTVVVCICFHLVYLVLPLLFVFGPIVLLFTDRWSYFGATWIAAYLSWFVLSHHSEIDGRGRPWVAFENLWLWRRIFEWFPIRLVASEALPSSGQQYIFGIHPHGGLAFGRAMFGFCTEQLWDQTFPGIDFRVLTATAAFRVPVIREMWLWSYCIDASKPVAMRALSSGKSLLLYPGGVKEQIMTERGKHRVYLKNRKGFIKLALQHGCSLVPIYVFGESDLYHHWSLGLCARKWVVDKFGAAIMILSGSFGLLPFRVPITGVSGPPIDVEKIENPTQQQIDDLHAKYVGALQKLFDSQKAAYGYNDAILEVF